MQLGTPSKRRYVWKFKLASVYPKVVCTVLTSCTGEKTRASRLNHPELAPQLEKADHIHTAQYLALVLSKAPTAMKPSSPFCFWFKIMVTTSMVCLQHDTESTLMIACGDISVHN